MADPALFLLVSAGLTLLFLWQQENRQTQATIAIYALIFWTTAYLLARYQLELAMPWVPVLWGLVGWAILLWGMGINLWQAVLVALPPFILAFALAEAVTLSLLWGLVTAVPVAFLLAYRYPPPSTTDAAELPNSFSATTMGELPTKQPAHMQALFNVLDEGVVVGDEHGRVLYVNKHAAELIGTTPTEITGQHIMEVLAHLPMITPAPLTETTDSPHLHIDEEAPPPAQPVPPPFEMNGRLIQGHMHVIYDNQQQLQYSVAILHDVTDSYQAQRAKTAFLTNISHELRTPLTAIKGYVELLDSNVSGELNQEQKLFVKIIHRNVMRMVQLINSLIFVSSVKGGTPKPRGAYADLRQLVSQIAREQEPLALRSQQEIITNIDPLVPPIQADSIHIATVLQELLHNSIKFNQPGGKIWISVGRQTESLGMSLASGEPEDFVVVQIKDEGIGIAPADQLHIFDEFYRAEAADTAAKGGMGVGLAIVRALVEAYNGRIWIDSELGMGSTFTLLLPTKQNEQTVTPLPAVGVDLTPT